MLCPDATLARYPLPSLSAHVPKLLPSLNVSMVASPSDAIASFAIFTSTAERIEEEAGPKALDASEYTISTSSPAASVDASVTSVKAPVPPPEPLP